MREKLIELMFRAIQKNIKAELHGEKIDVIISQGNIADHLIANGVTIPVRCKDCGVWKRREDGLINCPYCTDLKKDDDFCSYGERRTDD